jgi:hypothetical protein
VCGVIADPKQACVNRFGSDGSSALEPVLQPVQHVINPDPIDSRRATQSPPHGLAFPQPANIGFVLAHDRPSAENQRWLRTTIASRLASNCMMNESSLMVAQSKQ